jgi:phosphatidylinositol alpha-mannosyltransferase
MKIVQVCPYDIDRPGGVQAHILSLGEALAGRGHDVTVIAPGPAPHSARPDCWYVGGRRTIGFSGTRFEVSYVGRDERHALQKRLARWQPDIVHFHTIWTPAMPMQLFASRRSACVATFHDTPPDTLSGAVLRVLFGVMSRWFLNRLDGAVAVSQAPARHLSPGRRGVQPEILPPATDLSPFVSARKSDENGVDTPFQVLFVGRLEQRKGITCLLAAWRLLLDRENQAEARPLQLVIAGDGPLRPEVEAMVNSAPRGSVRLVEAPDRPSVVQLLGNADLFVAPSLYGESFGIVLAEAMTSGTPVVAADNRGYVTVMRGEGRSGLFAAGDASALAHRIEACASDPALCASLAQWGIEEARQYDISQVVSAFEALYERALENHRQPRGGLGR